MRVSTWHRSLPIRVKLRIIVMLSVSVALVAACGTILAYEEVAFRADMRNDLGVFAEMYGSNSTAALSFNDQQTAAEILSGFRAKRHIVSAILYSANGLVFASYGRDTAKSLPAPPLRPDGSWFENGQLVLFKQILLRGQPVGTVYLASDLGELDARIKRFGWVVLASMLVACVSAVGLSSWLQRIISNPIAALSGAANLISHQKNYSVRAIKQADDELGQLVDTFNEMLSEIESRDGVLLAHQDRLEDEVAKRTAELGRSEERYRSTIEAAPDAIVVANGEGNIVLVNSEAEKTFGHPRESLLGRNMDLLFPERFRHSERYAPYLANGQSQTAGGVAELVALRTDGAEFPVEVGLRRLETEEGVLIFSAIRDITERKNAEQRNRQLEIVAAEAHAANKAKSMFLSTMSHEIRTPMNAILGYSQLMLRDPNLGTDTKTNLKIINRSGEHLLNIINDVLDMAKIEAGRLQLSPDTFDLRFLLQDLAAMFRLRAEEKGIQFEVLISGEPVEYIVADEGKIRQVLINLLGNATKFTERGRINLRVSLDYRTNHRLWMSAQIEDTGIGLTEEEQSQLFQPFVQGHAGQHRHGGTGLGLAISRGVAELMSGNLTVSSTLGSGSNFRFEIPVELGADRDARKQSGHRGRVLGIQGGQDPPRILIVDDLLDNREWLNKLLTAVGFSVRLAEDGEDAVRTWREWNPRLILMDMRMPGMDGLEATRRIKADPRAKQTAIVTLTASALDDDRRAAFESGADDFLAKPCLEDELLEKMRVLLDIVYIHEEVSGTERPPPAGAATQSAKRLVPLSFELVEELRNATFSGNKILLDTLILKVRETEDAGSAQVLQKLADNYEYEALTRLLTEACSAPN